MQNVAQLSLASSLCIEKSLLRTKTSEAGCSRKYMEQSTDRDSGPAQATGQPEGPRQVLPSPGVITYWLRAWISESQSPGPDSGSSTDYCVTSGKLLLEPQLPHLSGDNKAELLLQGLNELLQAVGTEWHSENIGYHRHHHHFLSFMFSVSEMGQQSPSCLPQTGLFVMIILCKIAFCTMEKII